MGIWRRSAQIPWLSRQEHSRLSSALAALRELRASRQNRPFPWVFIAVVSFAAEPSDPTHPYDRSHPPFLDASAISAQTEVTIVSFENTSFQPILENTRLSSCVRDFSQIQMEITFYILTLKITIMLRKTDRIVHQNNSICCRPPRELTEGRASAIWITYLQPSRYV